MGSSATQGELWGKAPRDWTDLQEPKHKPLWEAMLDAAEVGRGTRFLDAGCGGAGASVLAAERGARVSGVDAAEPLIRIARERVPYGDFRVGDLEDLPYTDGEFDAVIAANSLQYAGDRVVALRELKRVCKSSGRVVVGLWATPDKVEYRAVFRAVGDSLPEPPPGDGPFGLSGPGKLEGLLEEAGIQVIGGNEVNCPFEYPSFDVFWRATTSAGPVQSALRTVGQDKLKAAVQNAVLPFQADDGSIFMDNYFRYVAAAVNGSL